MKGKIQTGVKTGSTLSGFLNVDLEIESGAKLDTLLAEWGEKVFVLYHGPGVLKGGPAPGLSRHLLPVEGNRPSRDPDAAIHALCALVEGLSPGARRRWDRARKSFDVGYRHLSGGSVVRFALRPDTLARVVASGATLAISVYPFEEGWKQFPLGKE